MYGERAEFKNYRDFSLLNYAGILRDYLPMSKGVFRSGRGCVEKIFTVKQLSEKARKKK